MYWLQLGLLVVLAYLIGAVPSGLLIGRLLGKDLLKMGSGKLGATNSMNWLGRRAAAAVGVSDFGKGLVAVFLPWLVAWPDNAWLAIVMGCTVASAIIGHNWSVWVRLLSGKWGGGRGIAVALAGMLVVHPLVLLVAVFVGIGTLVASRYVVVATLVGFAAGIVAAGVLAALGQLSSWFLPGCLAWGLLVVVGFHDNIDRFLKGTETRLGQRGTT